MCRWRFRTHIAGYRAVKALPNSLSDYPRSADRGHSREAVRRLVTTHSIALQARLDPWACVGKSRGPPPVHAAGRGLRRSIRPDLGNVMLDGSFFSGVACATCCRGARRSGRMRSARRHRRGLRSPFDLWPLPRRPMTRWQSRRGRRRCRSRVRFPKLAHAFRRAVGAPEPSDVAERMIHQGAVTTFHDRQDTLVAWDGGLSSRSHRCRRTRACSRPCCCWFRLP